jgi:hypothetical protein
VMCHARRLYRRSSIHFFPEATNRQIFSSLPLNHFYSLKIRENIFLLFVRVAVPSRPVVIVDAISRLAASRVVQGLLNFGQGNTRRKEKEKRKKKKCVLQQQSGALYNPLTKSRQDDPAEKKRKKEILKFSDEKKRVPHLLHTSYICIYVSFFFFFHFFYIKIFVF